MNKIIKTRVGDEIHYYVNGVESYGVVAKMSASFVTIFKEDGLFYEVPLTDTFFVKDILINKTWNDMSMEERADQLVKIKAYSPRFLGKSWEQLPPELREVMKIKDGALPTGKYEHGGQTKESQATLTRYTGIGNDKGKIAVGDEIGDIKFYKDVDDKKKPKVDQDKSNQLIKLGKALEALYKQKFTLKDALNPSRGQLRDGNKPKDYEYRHGQERELGRIDNVNHNIYESPQSVPNDFQRQSKLARQRFNKPIEEDVPRKVGDLQIEAGDDTSHQKLIEASDIGMPKPRQRHMISNDLAAKLASINKKSLEVLYKQKFENYFGNDEEPPTTKRSVERKPQESKLDPETSKKIDQVRSRRKWGRGQQAERKKLGVETVDTKHIGTDGKTSFNNRNDRDSFDNIHDVLTGKKNVKLYEHTIKNLKKSLEALYKAERIMNKLISPIEGKPSSTGMTTGSHSGLHKKVQIKVPKDLLRDENFQKKVRTSVGGKLHDEKGDFSFNPKQGKSVYTDDNGETYYTIERDEGSKDKGGRNLTGKQSPKKPKTEKKRIGDKPTEPSDAQLELKKLMLARAAKSDQEQGLYGTAGSSSNVGISTDTKIDADKEYEGESHEDKKEEFKYEDEKPKVDQDKNKAVPLSQLNTWGIRYMTKEEREKFNSGQ